MARRRSASTFSNVQQHAALATRPFGELLNCLKLPEHGQIVLKYKGEGMELPRPDLAWAELRSLFSAQSSNGPDHADWGDG